MSRLVHLFLLCPLLFFVHSMAHSTEPSKKPTGCPGQLSGTSQDISLQLLQPEKMEIFFGETLPELKRQGELHKNYYEASLGGATGFDRDYYFFFDSLTILETIQFVQQRLRDRKDATPLALETASQLADILPEDSLDGSFKLALREQTPGFSEFERITTAYIVSSDNEVAVLKISTKASKPPRFRGRDLAWPK